MSSTTDSTTVAPVRRPNLINSLFPSVISGIVLGVVAAAVAGVLVNRLTTALSPDGVPNDDAVISAVYTAWVLFFFIGIGAFNGVIKWAFSRREPTYAEVRPRRHSQEPDRERDQARCSRFVRALR